MVVNAKITNWYLVLAQLLTATLDQLTVHRLVILTYSQLITPHYHISRPSLPRPRHLSVLLYRTCDYTCDIIDFLSKYHLSDVWYEERRKTVQVNGLPTTAAIIHNYIRVITRSGRPPVIMLAAQ